MRPTRILTACLLLGTLAAIAPQAAAVTYPGNPENFDSYQAGLLPGDAGVTDFYTYYDTGDANCRVSNTYVHSAPNSIEVQEPSGGSVCNGGAGYFDLHHDYCADYYVHYSFWMYIAGSALPGLSTKAYLESNTATYQGVGALIDSSGNLLASVKVGSTTTNGNAVPGFTAAANTWIPIDVQVYANSVSTTGVCSTGNVNNVIVTAPNGASSQVLTDLQFGGTNLGRFRVSGLGTANVGIWLDDMSFDLPISADGTATFTNLRGVDIDPFGGKIMIARTADGSGSTPENIRAYNAMGVGTIGQIGTVTNSCAGTGQRSNDGVLAFNEVSTGKLFTAYLDCTQSSASSNVFKVRNEALGPPSQAGTYCTGTPSTSNTASDWCDVDLQGTATDSFCRNSAGQSASDLSGQAGQIADVLAFPISWKNTYNPAIGFKNGYIGFAYTTITSGDVGVWVIHQVHDQSDVSCNYELNLIPGGGTPTQICTFHSEFPGYQGDYIAAVGDGADTTVWKVVLENIQEASQYDSPPRLSMTPVVSLSGAYRTAKGISCEDMKANGDGGRLLVATADNALAVVQGVGPSAGREIRKTSGGVLYVAGGPRIVSGQKDPVPNAQGNYIGPFALVKTGALTYSIYNITSLKSVATIGEGPTGSFKALQLTNSAQYAFVCTSTTCIRYDVHSRTTIKSVCDICGPDGGTIDQFGNVGSNPTTVAPPSTGGNPFIPEGAAIPAGFTQATLSMTLGVLMVLIMALGCYAAMGRSFIAGGFGGVVGFFLAFAFGLFPLWILLFIVLILATVFVIKFRGAAG